MLSRTQFENVAEPAIPAERVETSPWPVQRQPMVSYDAALAHGRSQMAQYVCRSQCYSFPSVESAESRIRHIPLGWCV